MPTGWAWVTDPDVQTCGLGACSGRNGVEQKAEHPKPIATTGLLPFLFRCST